jgi:hypothetical protein
MEVISAEYCLDKLKTSKEEPEILNFVLTFSVAAVFKYITK